MASVVTLLTDFGLQDSYLAEMKAVLLKADPLVQLIDITHFIEPYDIRMGAFQLLRSYQYFPKGTYHLGVVDPGVGSARRCVYVKTKNFHFIGPDNGLLVWAVRDAEVKDGEKAQIYEIEVSDSSSVTFHGRDVFAPFVVQLIQGTVPLNRPLENLVGDEFPGSREIEGRRRGVIIGSDHFGNIITSVRASSDHPVEALIENREERLQSFDCYSRIEEGRLGLIRGSHGFWEIAGNQIPADTLLGVDWGDEITIYPLES